MTNIFRGNVCHAFIENYGFEPFTMFCQLTGKPIGRFEEDEIISLIDSLSTDDDAESVADDIAMRLFASMRPSMRWNKLRAESLLVLSEQAPNETLAYLLNRLFARPDHLKTTMDQRVVEMHDRIRTFRFISEKLTQTERDHFLHVLLEIDAKWGLDKEVAPFAWDQFWNAIDSVRNAMVKAWYERRCKDHDKRVKQEELSSKWFRRGNALAKPAFVKSYLKQKPAPKPATLKAKAKSEESEFMEGLLSGIIGDLRKADDAPLDKLPAAPIQTKSTAPKFVRPSTKAPAWLKKK